MRLRKPKPSKTLRTRKKPSKTPPHKPCVTHVWMRQGCDARRQVKLQSGHKGDRVKQKATTSITLDKAAYWELKAAILQAQQVQAEAQKAVEQAQQRAVSLATASGLDPQQNYTLNDADLTATAQ